MKGLGIGAAHFAGRRKVYKFSCPECENEIKISDTRCSNCKILLDWETWKDLGYVDKHLGITVDNIRFRLAVVYLMVLHAAVIVIYLGPFNSIYSMS